MRFCDTYVSLVASLPVSLHHFSTRSQHFSSKTLLCLQKIVRLCTVNACDESGGMLLSWEKVNQHPQFPRFGAMTFWLFGAMNFLQKKRKMELLMPFMHLLISLHLFFEN
jgi:hypothetical protein